MWDLVSKNILQDIYVRIEVILKSNIYVIIPANVYNDSGV